MPIIGQGSYGCVIKPALSCLKETHNLTNKVTKVLTEDDATKEMSEYGRIEKVDPDHRFYLGVPVKCKFDPLDLPKIAKCNNYVRGKKYSLLQLEDGGKSLTDIYKVGFKEPLNNVMHKFTHLFDALLLYKKKSVSHNDINPNNVVYDKKFNIIDFGLMTDINELIYKFQGGYNDSKNIGNWHYPIEFNVYNADLVYSLRSEVINDLKNLLKIEGRYVDDIISNTKKESVAYKAKHKDDRFFSSYTTQFGQTLEKDLETVFRQNYFTDSRVYRELVTDNKMLTHLHTEVFNGRVDFDEYVKNPFIETLKKIIQSDVNYCIGLSVKQLDSYGLGLTIMMFLTKFCVDESFYAETFEVLYGMMHPNIMLRTSIIKSATQYKKITGTIPLSASVSKIIKTKKTLSKRKSFTVAKKTRTKSLRRLKSA